MLQEEMLEFAAERQRTFDATVAPRERKERGHFGTSTPIAQFMAGMFTTLPVSIRLLDPGAGVGTLTAAVCERILAAGGRRTISAELWENDPHLIPLLERTMLQCQTALNEAGHEFTFAVYNADFILSNRQATLFSERAEAQFDLAILNPP